MSAALICPGCDLRVPLAELEVHLRLELDYAAWHCLRCRALFLSHADARLHYASPYTPHPDATERLLQLFDKAKLDKLRRLHRAALAQLPPALAEGQADLIRRLDRFEEQSGPATQEETPSNMMEREHRRPNAPPRAVDTEPSEEEMGTPEREADEGHGENERPNQIVKLESVEAARDVKPTVKMDGKVACLKCDSRQLKSNFQSHVMQTHMSIKPIICDICSFKTKEKRIMKRHQKKRHDVVMNKDSHVDIMSSFKAEIERVVEECFGSFTDAQYKKIHCRSCNRDIAASQRRRHIAVVHLKRTVRSCRRCPFASHNWEPGNTQRHLRRAHGEEMSEQNHDDRSATLLPLINAMSTELYDTA